MNKITKNINDASNIDFYDSLTDKQRDKFDNEKESFTIDFSEVSTIYATLNDHQTRVLFLAIAMFASAGKKSAIDPDILDELNSDAAVLSQFNSIACRIKNNTKSWLNGQGKKKSNYELADLTYDSKNGYWKANPTASVKAVVAANGETVKSLNEYLKTNCHEENEIPDIHSENFQLWIA